MRCWLAVIGLFFSSHVMGNESSPYHSKLLSQSNCNCNVNSNNLNTNFVHQKLKLETDSIENKNISKNINNNINNNSSKNINIRNQTPELPKIGNFVLPPSQQPGSFFSFGQNIVNKGDVLLIGSSIYLRGQRRHFTDVAPEILYGITDVFSIDLAVPYFIENKVENQRSQGVADSSIQLEYAFHNKLTSEYSQQATVVATAFAPTGSFNKNPPTGFGSMSYFLGVTFSRIYAYWFGYTSYGAFVTTSHHGNKLGNRYLYQMGLGRNILSIEDTLIFAAQAEIAGAYTTHDKIKGMRDPDSGGNEILIVPSLWLSTKKTSIQFGAAYPILQKLFGMQLKDKYLIAIAIRHHFH